MSISMPISIKGRLQMVQFEYAKYRNPCVLIIFDDALLCLYD